MRRFSRQLFINHVGFSFHPTKQTKIRIITSRKISTQGHWTPSRLAGGARLFRDFLDRRAKFSNFSRHFNKIMSVWTNFEYTALFGSPSSGRQLCGTAIRDWANRELKQRHDSGVAVFGFVTPYRTCICAVVHVYMSICLCTIICICEVCMWMQCA